MIGALNGRVAQGIGPQAGTKAAGQPAAAASGAGSNRAASEFAALLAGFLAAPTAPAAPAAPVLAPGLADGGADTAADGMAATDGDAESAPAAGRSVAVGAGAAPHAEARRPVDAPRLPDAPRIIDVPRLPDGRSQADDPEPAAHALAADGAESAPAAPRRAGRVPPVSPVGSRMDPEFTVRLDRTIRRMRDEFGHEVRVVEGWRSQERQDALHAQGRTTAGPVVTWTRNSHHTTGRAADVIIDGTYDNPVGYKRLAAIAAEEGLRTLGAKDPGHLELAGGKPGTGHTHGRAFAGGFAAPVAPGGIAAPAPVAFVAQVARVAPAGVSRGVAGDEAAPDALRPPVARADAPFTATTATFTAPATAAGVNAAERTAQILDVMAARDAAPGQSVLLRLDDAGGAVRLGMRGNTVHAAIVTPEAGLAADLGRHLHQLRDALAAKGLDAAHLSVRSTASGNATMLRADGGADAATIALLRGVETSTASAQARQQHDSDTPRRQPDPEHRHSPDRDPRSRREQQRKES